VVDELSRRVLLRYLAGASAAGALAGCGSLTGRLVLKAPTTPLTTPTLAPHTSSPALSRPFDVGSLPANELGLIPVFMFHRVTDTVRSDYDITPDDLWATLTRLYVEGYRPIRAIDLVRRRIQVPRGRTPVVLTFDDSSPGQFHRLSAGEVSPRSGVGVLQAFHRKHPAFAATGTLYLNGHPFDLPNTAVVLRSLSAAGFELGNHTLDHVNLGQVSTLKGQQEIVELQDLMAAAVPGRDPATFSLPYGVWPVEREITVSGSWQGRTYHHEGVMLVGSAPAASPYSTGWDPKAIPRIRAATWDRDQMFCHNWWLNRLARDPQTRYVSSGRPGSVTYPRHLAAGLAPQFKRVGRPYSA
jgi:hypothetical protein